jgi:hypothetical protein
MLRCSIRKKMYYVTIRYKNCEARTLSFCVLTIIVGTLYYIYKKKSTTGNTIRIFQLISFFSLLLVN